MNRRFHKVRIEYQSFLHNDDLIPKPVRIRIRVVSILTSEINVHQQPSTQIKQIGNFF